MSRNTNKSKNAKSQDSGSATSKRQIMNSKPLPQKPKAKPLPPTPKRTEKTRQERREGQLQYKDTDGRRWWNLTGDVLYDLGSKAINHGLSVLSGFGDYEVNTNSLLAAATEGKNGGSVPIMRNSKVANIIRHREYVGDVIGSTDSFTLKKYAINPGLDDTFPWLSPIAQCYTNYRMRGAMAEFVSLATEYSAVPYIGYVAMATQYNALDTSFTNKKELENSEYANSCKPPENLCHPIECASDQLALHELYIRDGAIVGDQRLYDLGQLSIAVGGQASATIIGELWITYEVELYFPKLATINGKLVQNYFSRLSSFTNSTPMAGTTKSGNEASTLRLNTASPLSAILNDEAIGQRFYVTISWQGGSVTRTDLPVITGNNATVSNVMNWPFGGAVASTFSTSFVLYLDKGAKGGFDIDNSPTLPTYSAVLNQSFLAITQIPIDQTYT